MVLLKGPTGWRFLMSVAPGAPHARPTKKPAPRRSVCVAWCSPQSVPRVLRLVSCQPHPSHPPPQPDPYRFYNLVFSQGQRAGLNGQERGAGEEGGGQS